MGLLNYLFGSQNSSQNHPQCGGVTGPAVATLAGTKHETSGRVNILPFPGGKKGISKTLIRRVCRVEELEERRLMSANPIEFGSVYHENNVSNDMSPDTFIVSWNGGETGTTLDKIVISLDLAKVTYDSNGVPDNKNVGNGLYDNGDGIFNTKASDQYGFGAGVDADGNSYNGFHPFNVDTQNTSSGIRVTNYVVSDDQMTLTLYFENFTAGKQFVFNVDVDRVIGTTDDGYFTNSLGVHVDKAERKLDENGNQYFVNASGEQVTRHINTVNYGSIAFDGAECQTATISAYFNHSDYQNVTVTGVYMDKYDDVYKNGSGATMSSVLNLPDDNYNYPGAGMNNTDLDATSGAFKSAVQVPLPSSISGNIGVDTSNAGNNKNILDAGDQRLQGVKLELWVKNEPGVYVPATSVWNAATKQYETRSTGLTTITGANGAYSFEGLPPGVYQVREVQPDGYIGNQAYYFNSDKLTYHYFNANGEQLNYLGDVLNVIRIYDGPTFPGNFSGTTELIGTNLDAISNVNIPVNSCGVEYNFLELLGGSISGYVAADTSRVGQTNGVNNKDHVDSGDDFLQGVRVDLLDSDGHVIATKYTDANGYYAFTGLAPGTYSTRETQPARYNKMTRLAYYFDSASNSWYSFTSNGTKQTYTGNADNLTTLYEGFSFPGNKIGNSTTPNVIATIIVIAGNEKKDNDYLERLGGRLEGNVSIHDTGDPIPGVTVILVDSDGNETRTTTDDNGNYRFDNLDPDKTYTVKEVQPAGYCDGDVIVGDHDGTASGANDLTVQDVISSIKPGSDSASGYNFIERREVSVSGYVYEDVNNNGIKETGETGIANVRLWLWVLNPTTGQYEQVRNMVRNPNTGVYEASSLTYTDKNGQIVSTPYKFVMTDTDGHYEFLICPDRTYKIGETQPDNYISGKNAPGTVEGTTVVVGAVIDNARDEIEGINLTNRDGQTLVNNNFGELRLSSLSGYVYEDLTRGSDGRSDENLGNSAKTNNGVFDAGEKGIEGVVLELWKWNETTQQYEQVKEKWNTTTKTFDSISTVLTATTVANGKYDFSNVRPGLYKIVERQPDDYLDGKVTAGKVDGVTQGTAIGGLDLSIQDIIQGIRMNSGSQGADYNFGELPSVKISGYVFQDGDTIVYTDVKPDVTDVRDGKITATDKRFEGIKITLCNRSGDPLDDGEGGTVVAYTNANGYYSFDDYLLEPDTYTLKVEAPMGDYERGINTAGTIDNKQTQSGTALTEKAANSLTQQSLSQLSQTGISTSNLVMLADRIIGMELVRYGDVSVNNDFSRVLYEQKTQPPSPPEPPTPYYNYPGPPQGSAGPQGLNPGLIYTPPTLNSTLSPGIGGAGLPPDSYAWHLSIIDAGYPRSVLSDYDVASGYRAQGQYTTVAWQSYDMTQTLWTVYDMDGKRVQTLKYGPGFGVPVAGDFNGDGIAEIAIYCDGIWYIDLNGNGVWDDNDLWAKLGGSSDQPVVGDWDGDGKADIAVFGPQWPGDGNALANEPGLPTDLNRKVALRPKNVPPNPQDTTSTIRALKHTTKGRVRLDVIDHVFQYGAESDRAVSGDFNGDGITEIGVYRNGTWYIDYNGNGRFDSEDIVSETTHSTGDIPVTGHFTDREKSQIGLYNPATGRMIIDTNGDFKLDESDRIFYLEGMDDPDVIPVIGDTNGDGIDEIMLVKHLDKIPMQTRLVPSSPTPLTAPVAPSVTSEVTGPRDSLLNDHDPHAPVEVLDMGGSVAVPQNAAPPASLF